MSDQISDHQPPAWALKVMNPIMRLVLPSKLGARVPLGLLRVTGRRTGRRYAIPVGVWPVDEGMVVFTSAPWLENFRGGASAELVLQGRARPVRGEVIEDPTRVGPWLRAALARTSPRQLGLSVAAGHTVTDDEAASMRRAVLLREDR